MSVCESACVCIGRGGREGGSERVCVCVREGVGVSVGMYSCLCVGNDVFTSVCLSASNERVTIRPQYRSL